MSQESHARDDGYDDAAGYLGYDGGGGGGGSDGYSPYTCRTELRETKTRLREVSQYYHEFIKNLKQDTMKVRYRWRLNAASSGGRGRGQLIRTLSLPGFLVAPGGACQADPGIAQEAAVPVPGGEAILRGENLCLQAGHF